MTMKIEKLILEFLSKTKTKIHQKRATILAKMAVSAMTNPKAIYLTNLGRNLNINAYLKHKIKTADRLIGNKQLHSERLIIYQMLAHRLLAEIDKPVILVDWSPLCGNQEKQLLRAAFCLNGKRSIALYEEVHPRELLGNPKIQNQFLQTLKANILPQGIIPIIIADSGFRVPFFKKVQRLGWHFLGRIRNRDFIALTSNEEHFFSAKELYAQATEIPESLGNILWVRSQQFSSRLFLYHKPKKGRIDKDLNGNRRRAKSSRKQADREAEPWLLVASQSLDISAKQAVDYYTTRMQIEIGFRDTKSPYYGLGLTNLSRIKPYRYENLLIIVALAMLGLWLVDNEIYAKKNS